MTVLCGVSFSCYFDMDRNHEDYKAQLQVYAEQIFKLMEDRSHKYDNRHSLVFYRYIGSLLKRYPNNPDRRGACLALAALLIFAMKTEFYYRSVYDEGSLYPEDLAYYKYFESEFDKVTDCLMDYVEQSSEDHPWAEVNWGVYFLTDYLRHELLYHQGMQIATDSKLREEWFPALKDAEEVVILENFLKVLAGLYPIISDETCVIYSHMYMKYTQSNNFAFLLLPYGAVDNFSRYIPGYLHEIFHYIPPVSRSARNHVALRLLVHTILSEWGDICFKHLSEIDIDRHRIKKIYEAYFNQLFGYMLEKNTSLAHIKAPANKKFPVELDSMALLLLLTQSIYITPEENFIDLLLKTEIPIEICSDSEQKMLQQLVSDNETALRHMWTSAAHDHAVTYNTLLRELRSDINMAILLDIQLVDYLEIMANDPLFAKQPVDVIGDTTIFRFGLMVGLLSTAENSQKFTPCASKEELTRRKTVCEKAFSTIQAPLTQIENLRAYLDLYFNMTVEMQDGYYTLRYHSLLEEELAEQINDWADNARTIKEYGSIRLLRDIYKQKSGGNVLQTITEKSLIGLQECDTLFFPPQKPQ